MRWTAASAGLLLSLALGGCAMLNRPKQDNLTSDQTLRSGASLIDLRVDAPGDLKALLENNLDLARLSALSAQDAVSEPELARLVGAAPAQVRELLETEGYFEPVVQVRREPGERPVVRVHVEPGPRTVVGRFDLVVQGDLERAASSGDANAKAVIERLNNAWPLKVGVPFRNPRWTEAKSNILAQLRGEGYASATWSGTAATVDVPSDTVRLFVVADSGPLYRFGSLDVRGLERQHESTVRNLMGFGPGTPLTDKLLLDFQDRLQGAGLFDRVTVVLEPDPGQADTTRVIVTLHELPLQQSVIGVGYSNGAGPRVSVEHWHRRAFGFNWIARNRVEWGRDRQTFEGDLSSDAKADLWRNIVGYAVSRQESSSDVVTSARLRLGRSQSRPMLDRLYFVEGTTATNAAGAVHEHSNAVSGNYNWVRRELDNPVLPTKGYTLSVETALGRATANNVAGAFSRLYTRGTVYRPLGGNWFGQARLELGQVIVANGVDVPDPLRFRAGGDDSVRGYAYRTLAPTHDGALTGGKALFTSSVEVARPISPRLPSVWGAVFIDAGRAADRFSALKPAYGTGFGVRWRSPVGPLSVDLAYGNETHRVRLHLSVGIAF
ncbi:MAG TPA: BamA/TamA family outer membrane protein [Burkholderiaceae bacterium]|nr:BamA/TamA family outer membrane protein [Burkholderiaceae bacterium]